MVDADLKAYFDSIPHERLMERVEERISDGRVLGLLRGWLEQDILRGMERWTPTGGTPQGAVISPLLANIYLHPLDERMAARGYRMVRYADDFVVLCSSREEAEAALAKIRGWVAENGLRLHPDKTHVGDCREAGGGFDFLGYRFEAGRRWVRERASSASRTASGPRRGGRAGTASRGSSPTSTRCCEAGSATSSMPIRAPFASSTVHPTAAARAPAQAGKAARLRTLSGRP